MEEYSYYDTFPFRKPERGQDYDSSEYYEEYEEEEPLEKEINEQDSASPKENPLKGIWEDRPFGLWSVKGETGKQKLLSALAEQRLRLMGFTTTPGPYRKVNDLQAEDANEALSVIETVPFAYSPRPTLWKFTELSNGEKENVQAPKRTLVTFKNDENDSTTRKSRIRYFYNGKQISRQKRKATAVSSETQVSRPKREVVPAFGFLALLLIVLHGIMLIYETRSKMAAASGITNVNATVVESGHVIKLFEDVAHDFVLQYMDQRSGKNETLKQEKEAVSESLNVTVTQPFSFEPSTTTSPMKNSTTMPKIFDSPSSIKPMKFRFAPVLP